MIVKLLDSTSYEYGVEHLSYSFDIDGISRACLQELARHRISSYTVKSSRYTLSELKKERKFHINDLSTDGRVRVEKYVRLTGNTEIDMSISLSLEMLRSFIVEGIPNDIAKYCMPEAYKTSLVMTINARALQNFLELRSSKHALWEIQNLAKAIYDVLPENHKFLFDYIYEKGNI